MRKLKLNHVLKKTTVLLLCCFLAGITGCGSRSKPSSFYLLTSLPASESIADSTEKSMGMSVGPVRLPSYLDRKQLLFRTGKNEIVVREYNRWGEPLQENFQRVLMENLSVLLATAQVYDYDNTDFKEVDFQLIVDVNRFDISEDGQAVLVAFWSIKDGKGNMLLRKKTILNAKGKSLESPDIVHALNQMVIDFSTELAKVIRSME